MELYNINKNIDNYNTKGDHHGYQQRVRNNKILLRVNYKNNIEIGYEEWHFNAITNYYIK